jgi:trehalose-6-phosphatase
MARSPADLVAALAADPKHGAIVCDIDGTLAPIAVTPELARVLP